VTIGTEGRKEGIVYAREQVQYEAKQFKLLLIINRASQLLQLGSSIGVSLVRTTDECKTTSSSAVSTKPTTKRITWASQVQPLVLIQHKNAPHYPDLVFKHRPPLYDATTGYAWSMDGSGMSLRVGACVDSGLCVSMLLPPAVDSAKLPLSTGFSVPGFASSSRIRACVDLGPCASIWSSECQSKYVLS
jgi:hypothetical protein